MLTLDEALAQNTAMPMIRKAKDPDEDVQQRIPAIDSEGSNQTGCRTRTSRFPGTQVATGTLRTPAAGPLLSGDHVPWPSPARTTR